MSQTCANPLYLQWIREWWDSAAANNAKDRLTYKGAWESMKANPIHFTHPSEAIKLRGIGPKLVKRLTEKLRTHCQEHGLPVPQEPSKKRPTAAGSQPHDDQDNSQGASPPKKARKVAPKGYVPKPRSGAYALLLTLAQLPEDQTMGLTKAELQIQAQPLADSSFTVPPDPSKFHTAWSSMGTLESKHLVYTFGRPVKKYALTQEGWRIAKSMKRTLGTSETPSESNQEQTKAPSTHQSGQDRHPSRPRVTIDIDDEDESPTRDDFEERIQSKFGSKENFQKFMTDRAFGLADAADIESLDLMKEFAQRATHGGYGSRTPPTSMTSVAQAKNGTSIPFPPLTDRSDVSRNKTLARSVRQLSSTTDSNPRSLAPGSSTAEGITTYAPIVVMPGSFTVELVLDSREVRSKTDRNYIQDQFNKAGLRCEQRALQVGDMIWTAKIHDPEIVNQLEVSDRQIPEIVLDYVVERKRLDDLDSSIKDRRFLEQKFRLKRSGIQNAIYIIEDYGSISAMEDQQHTRMVTAIAATQVIDGFFVKRTKKLDDTIAYLHTMTKLLKERYENKPLLVIPSSKLTPQNHFLLRAPAAASGEHHYITYEAQAGLASKSATLTSRDIFLKMLMCTRGVTGDKAIEIQKHWQVPRQFIESYESQLHVAQKHDMVYKKAGNYQDKRKIGKAVSQTLAEIWGKT